MEWFSHNAMFNEIPKAKLTLTIVIQWSNKHSWTIRKWTKALKSLQVHGDISCYNINTEFPTLWLNTEGRKASVWLMLIREATALHYVTNYHVLPTEGQPLWTAPVHLTPAYLARLTIIVIEYLMVLQIISPCSWYFWDKHWLLTHTIFRWSMCTNLIFPFA